MAKRMTKEEHIRSQRRRRRQFTGLMVLLLVVVGLGTVLSWGAKGVAALLDDSDRREAYESRLAGLVMLDPLPFDSVEQADPTMFKEAAIWGTVYRVTTENGSLDVYERDTETDCVILPSLEVNAYLTQLLGPDYEVENASFGTEDMDYVYQEEKAGYLVPVTGQVALYTAQVEKIQKKGGLEYVTVGYIPTAASSNDLTLINYTEPVRYMDYVFARGENRQWYLTALQESEMKPAVSMPSADIPEYDLNYNPTEMLQEALSSEASSGEETLPSEAASEAVEPASAAE